MAQRTDLLAVDLDVAHVEELDLAVGAAIQLLNQLLGLRALDLEAPHRAGDRLAHRPHRGAIVHLHLDVELAAFAVVLEPVGSRRATDEYQAVLLEMEEDAVADDVAAIAAGCELLGAVDGELLVAVGAQVG